MKTLHLSRPEQNRLDREDQDRFRKEVETGQLTLFDDDINGAIRAQAYYNLPGIVEAVKELLRRNGRKTARAKPTRKLILVLKTGGRNA